MWPFDRVDPNAPRRDTRPHERPRVLDDHAGDAGVDGYTRLSIADRQSGIRPAVGSVPQWPRRPLE